MTVGWHFSRYTAATCSLILAWLLVFVMLGFSVGAGIVSVIFLCVANILGQLEGQLDRERETA